MKIGLGIWQIVGFRHQEHEYGHENFSCFILKSPQVDFPLTVVWFPDLVFTHVRIFRRKEQIYSDENFI